MRNCDNPQQIGGEAVDQEVRKTSQHEPAEVRIQWNAEFRVLQESLDSVAHLAAEAFAKARDISIVIGRGLNEFLLRLRVKLIYH